MKLLNQLTIKHLKLNKRRTIVTIIGIMLSTALMVGIGLLFSSARDTMIRDIEYYDGYHNASIKKINKNDLNILNSNKNIKKIFYSELIGFSKIESTNPYKPYLGIYNVSNNFFKYTNLLEGRYPTNNNEVVISKHIETNGGITYKIGDTLELDYGIRKSDNYTLDENVLYDESETLELKGHKTYKIVGIIERVAYEDYQSPGYSIFTINDTNNSIINAYLIFKSPKKTYDLIPSIAKQLNKEEKAENLYQDIDFNTQLLSMYGASKYDNYNNSIYGIMALILSIISVGCIIVIYNSFAISVMERKKQFGLFASIGATHKQLKYTVLFEAVVVGAIGIILGLLASFIGIGLLIMVINKLLGVGSLTLRLAAYPVYVIIPIIFMIVVILLSAIIPSKRAAKSSPIEIIRQNDDIKIKGKKVKSNKLITKLFGIEGDLAYKNIKRNKRKYRITILSLIVSVVLFISFSTFATYMNRSSNELLGNMEYDIIYSNYATDYNKKELDELFDKIRNNDQVKDSLLIDRQILGSVKVKDTSFSDDYIKYALTYKSNNELVRSENAGISVIKLSDLDYNKILKKYKLEDNTPILLNYYSITSYEESNRKIHTGQMLKDNKKLNICLSYMSKEDNMDNKDEYYIDVCDNYVDNYYIVNNKDISLNGYQYPTLIINDKLYNEFMNKKPYYSLQNEKEQLLVKAPKYDKLQKEVDELLKTYNGNITVNNYIEQLKMIRNMILVVKILVYGFIGLVTAIGITSVINTISTSIALRKKEFAVLRSIGLTPKGFNKMIRFESLFFGLKALLYSLPISFGIIYLLHLNMSNLIEFKGILIPWDGVLIAVVFVFIIIFIAMTYSVRRIKKDNILEAIREENI